MSSEALWALGRGNGIVALVFMSLSVALGIATRSGRPLLALPRFGVADIHRFVALAAVLLVALHFGLLFMDPYAKLKLIDTVVPFLGAYRPMWQGLGTVAVDLLIVVVITSLLRHRLGPRVFRTVHWTAYLLWPIAMAHALGNGTDVGHVWFTAIAAACGVVVSASLAWRLRANYTEYANV
ncbi:MAG: ferric reductase-like transmembrane domain-containing protein [Mycobacteriaceae bacterium]